MGQQLPGEMEGGRDRGHVEFDTSSFVVVVVCEVLVCVYVRCRVRGGL